MVESYLVHGMVYNFIHKKYDKVKRRISELIRTEKFGQSNC